MAMTDKAGIEKVIQDAYAARAANDLDAIARIFTPDAVFQMVGSQATFPGATRAEGQAQLLASVGALVQAFDFLEQTLLNSVIEDNKAATHWRLKVKHNATGEVFVTELFDLWTIDGGRVASLLQFCDTALLARIMSRQ
jgi:ketosteroid isomerase-like protein